MTARLNLWSCVLLISGVISPDPAIAFSARVEGNISLLVRSDGTLSSFSWAEY